MRKILIYLMTVVITLLGGCSVDDIREMEHTGGPFSYNIESARAYLLEQLQNKYGIEFFIVGNENLENYGPLAGASYSCDVAPSDKPDCVATALVSQTKYQKVRDDYALYFFKEEAEAQAIDLCLETEYVQSYTIALKLPQTPKIWNPDDDVNEFLKTSGAYLDIEIYLGDGRSDEEYADLILNFLESVYKLNANSKLSILQVEKKYLYWGSIDVFGEKQAQLPTKEKILEDMEIARMI